MTSKKYLVLLPTNYEAAPALKALGFDGKIETGAFAIDIGGNVAALATGVGCKKSAERVENAIGNFSPDTVILAGFCGACSPELKNGDVIYETDSEEIAELVKGFGGNTGKIGFADHIVGRDEKRTMNKAGYVGVEMESVLYREKAKIAGAKFAHIRWVSDSLELDVPPDVFQSTINMETGEMNISAMKMMWRIMKSPSLLVKLSKFGKEIAPAQKKFGKEIVEIVEKLRGAAAK